VFTDSYLTVKQPAQGLFKDKGSKFIGYIFPLESAEDVKGILAQLKAEHPKARHICWALRISTDRSVFRVNDDGEPSGTAGKPILNTLLSANLTQVCVAVVRYFGGTLLGVPGLIHAYKEASLEAIKAAEIIEKTIKDRYQVHVPYTQLNAVMKILKDENITIIAQELDNQCSLIIEI
jgi:uncharacterized YigZ family protein